jgi:hypothetical protein
MGPDWKKNLAIWACCIVKKKLNNRKIKKYKQKYTLSDRRINSVIDYEATVFFLQYFYTTRYFEVDSKTILFKKFSLRVTT